jgi:hypothetical protein
MLLDIFRLFSIRYIQGHDTDEDSDTIEIEETAAARALSEHAGSVLEGMAVLNQNVSLLHLLHTRVAARVQLREADFAPWPWSMLTLSRFPTYRLCQPMLPSRRERWRPP